MVGRDPMVDLRRRLGTRARPAEVRAIVRAWWRDHGFAHHPAAVGKRIALALLERAPRPDKLAAIVILGELLGDALRAGDLQGLAKLAAAGHLEPVADELGVRVLGTLLAREAGRADAIRGLVAWRAAETCAQRRAACLALATLAGRGDTVPGLTDAILVVCAAVVWSHEDGDQHAVGTVLRQLARTEPVTVEAFFRRYARLMSRACARRAVATLPAASRAELLAHHRRATTIRR